MSDMGPGLRLINARRRMLRAGLRISLAAVDDVSEPAGEITEPYQELTDAARELDQAQAAWDKAAAEKRDALLAE